MRLVPSERLIIWASLLIPFALLYAIDPAWGGLGMGMAALLLGVSILDAILAISTPCPVSLTMEPIQRLSRGRTGQATVHLHADSPTRPFLVGLPLPKEIACTLNPAPVLMPPDTTNASIPFALTPTQKGCYPIQTAYLQDSSPFLLWGRRHHIPIATELRVYPDMKSDRKRLAAHFLHRSMAGASPFRIVGQGREFERLREYVPGDCYGDIHWKVTAKRNRPVTKLFQVEHTQEIVVAIDAARLSARVHGDETALDRYIAATLLLGQIAQQQGDQFGVILFSDRVERFIRPGMGPAHYNACRDAIFSIEPRLVSPSYEELFSFLRLRLRRRAMVLLLTDLSDSLLAERFLDHVDLVSRTHLLSVAMPRASAGPQRFAEEADSVDDLYTQLATHLGDRRLATLQKDLSRRGIPLSMAAPEELAATLARRYFHVKSRQQL
jgi:uncharacterized protein (DUF58 family)